MHFSPDILSIPLYYCGISPKALKSRDRLPGKLNHRMEKPLSSLLASVRLSLRLKAGLAFGTPVILLVVLFFSNQYFRQRDILDQHFQLFTIQLGDVILGGLHNAMLKNDPEMIQSELNQISKTEGLNRVLIIDLQGVIQRTSAPEEEGTFFTAEMSGCVDCHSQAVSARPKAIHQKDEQDNLRVLRPIQNSPECHQCHPASQSHLGVLLIETSMARINQELVSGIWSSWLINVLAIVVGIFAALFLIQWVVIRPVEIMHRALSAFKNGDFSARVPSFGAVQDELTGLADTFNHMAETLERQQQEQQHSARIRQSAMMEERERIARELHDGVAQFISYVNAKTMAVQLLLEKNQVRDAERQLRQLELAVRDQSVDVRASIVGLKLTSEGGAGLAASLAEYLRQFNQISDLEIAFQSDPGFEEIYLDPEVELHLLRIVQEAVSNVRKHSGATQAHVNLGLDGGCLVLTVTDHGTGFNPYLLPKDQMLRFGLQMMHERASMIGAELSILSEPELGTTIRLTLRMDT
jgi:signal transduction histidine kinase